MLFLTWRLLTIKLVSRNYARVPDHKTIFSPEEHVSSILSQLDIDIICPYCKSITRYVRGYFKLGVK